MTNEMEALKVELAAARQEIEDLRLEFPDALLEGDLATGVAVRMAGEDVSRVLSRADQVMYEAKGRSLRSTRR